jgi:hypothetical protein
VSKDSYQRLAPYESSDTLTAPWQSQPFIPVAGRVTFDFRVTPRQVGMNAGVGLALGPPTTWSGLAAYVRFNAQGFVEARDGNVYRALVPYNAMTSYRVVFVVNVSTNLYSVYLASSQSSVSESESERQDGSTSSTKVRSMETRRSARSHWMAWPVLGTVSTLSIHRC